MKWSKLLGLGTKKPPKRRKKGRSTMDLGGECFPEGEKRVPYPNPHPDSQEGCFPDPPKGPKKVGW